MKDRPIPFSGPMVRAVLDGSKTQTRRVLKPQPLGGAPELLHHLLPSHQRWATDEPEEERVWKCPYGAPGDRLWVREAWHTHAFLDAVPPRDLQTRSIHYAADGKIQTGKLRPGMFMPRWASRITLEVAGVRVERLQDISEADARAEGAPYYEEGVDAPPPDDDHVWSYRASFRLLWESINGPVSWDANPWVWVVEFRRV